MIQCQFESGTNASLRHVVVDAVMIRDGAILLTKRAPTLRAGGQWAVPGGFVERDETIAEAVMREVLEETGYTCTVKQLIAIFDQPERRGDDRQNVSFIFEVEPIAKVRDGDTHEVTDAHWFPLDQLPPDTEMAFDHLEIIWEWKKQHDPVLQSTESE